MTCTVKAKNAIREGLQEARSRTNLGVATENDGVVISNLTKELKTAYQDLGKGKDPKEVLKNITKKENNFLFTRARAELKDVFKGGFGKKATIEFKLIDVTYNSNKEVFDVTVENTSKGDIKTYKFKRNANRSSLTEGKSVSLYIPNISIALNHALKARDNIKPIDKVNGNKELESIRRGLILGSSYGKLTMTGAKKRKGYTHGDIESMKSLVDDLEALDTGNSPEGYIDYTKSLLDKMHKHFFRDMDVFIKNATKNTGGFVNIQEKNMLIAAGKHNNKVKSNAEVYIHEVVHSITHWALSHPSAKTIDRELDYLFKLAGKKLTWQDFLDKSVEESSDVEIINARKDWDYIFNSDNAKEEFIAYGLTNPKTIDLLSKIDYIHDKGTKKSFLDKFMSLVFTAIDIVMGNYTFSERNNNAYEQLHSLAFRLAEINTKAESDLSSMNLWGRFQNFIDVKEDKFKGWAEDFQEKHFEKNEKITVPEDGKSLEGLLFAGKVLGKSLVDKRYRSVIGLTLDSWAKAGIPVKADGTVREFVRGFFEKSDSERIAENLSLANEHIDTERNTVIKQSYSTLTKDFKGPVSDAVGKSLTRTVMDTNLSTLVVKDSKVRNKRIYTNKQLREVMINPEIRNKHKKRAKIELEQRLATLGREKYSNWMNSQAEGLGYYMATHLGMPDQNLSGRNIVKGYMSNERFKLDNQSLVLVNEIAALNALNYTDKEDLDIAEKVLKEEWKGVATLMNTYESFKEQSQSSAFKDDEAHMIDGYSKEVFGNNIDIIYESMDKKDELVKAGYEFEGLVRPMHGEIRDSNIGMFILRGYGRTERLRGATNLSKNAARGTDLKEIKYNENKSRAEQLFERDKSRINVEAKKLQLARIKGENIDYKDMDSALLPVIDSTGKVVSYRYVMSKKRKEALLDQETNALEVMARTMGTLVDKELRETQNEKVLEGIKEIMKNDWEEGTLGKNLEEFTLIGPNSEDIKTRELYYMLPKNMQNFINSREDKIMAVPTYLMPILFGYKHFAFADWLTGKLPKEFVNIINWVESFYIDLVSILKGNILLKMPLILVSNIISNVFYLLSTTGMSLPELVKEHKESWQSAKKYLDSYRNINRLKIELGQEKIKARTISNTNSNAIIKKIEWEIKTIDKEMKNNSIHELFEAGLFQSIIEDVNTNILGDNNKLSEDIDKILDKGPTIIKKGAHYAYLTKETGWYKFNQEILQLSDLVARDIKNKKMKHAEKQMLEGKRLIPKEMRKILGIEENKIVPLTKEQKDKFNKFSKQYRMNYLLDAFINYNKPNGKFEEYMNRIGLLMFTKYFKRIQKVIGNTAMSNPIRFAFYTALATLAIDVDNISDQAFLSKGFGFDGDFSFTNLMPIYNPIDNIMEVLTPAIIKPETYMGLVG